MSIPSSSQINHHHDFGELMSDKTLTLKERWGQAIGVENALYERLINALVQLGCSEEEVDRLLDRWDDEDAQFEREAYPLTKHSVVYSAERCAKDSG